MVLALACWFWLGASLAAGILAVGFGAELSATAAAAGLALGPALVGFILLPRLGRPRADLALIAAWVLTASGLLALGGGASSPLVALFGVAPVLALMLRRPWAAEAGAAAVLAYACGAGLALIVPQRDLGPLPEILAVAGLAFAAGLIASSRDGGRSVGSSAMERVAEVSHELRTPLTHILGFSEMIERQLFGEIAERYVEYAGLIRKSGAHLLGLVNDLLDLSKIEAGRYDLELEEFDVRPLVAEMVRLSADSATRKHIHLGVVTPDVALTVRADERALRRILINVVGNAIKFTPEGGRVMVSAVAADGALVIDTVDSGPGIPEAEREKLGQAYERGSGGANAEGTGLGLSLVRALAALHGGTLSFHDAPGGGALVRIALPVLI